MLCFSWKEPALSAWDWLPPFDWLGSGMRSLGSDCKIWTRDMRGAQNACHVMAGSSMGHMPQ